MEVIQKSDHQSVWCFMLTVNGNNVFECGLCLPWPSTFIKIYIICFSVLSPPGR